MRKRFCFQPRRLHPYLPPYHLLSTPDIYTKHARKCVNNDTDRGGICLSICTGKRYIHPHHAVSAVPDCIGGEVVNPEREILNLPVDFCPSSYQ